MKPRLLIAGNFLSAFPGVTRGVCEELADRLAARGFSVLRTSKRRNRFSRLADMTATAWRYRGEYDIAQVDVYSGPAFLWAEAVCAVLRQAARPYVLTLHGGNLPHFASKWPGRVRRLLAGANIVTAPSQYLRRCLMHMSPTIELLPNAVDLARYPYRQRSLLRPRLVWMRAFHHAYNPQLAIRVLNRLAKVYPETELFMAGPDKGDRSFEDTRSLAKSLGMLERISFGGRIPKSEVPKWLAQGDIYLNTPRIDNTPVTVLEAMACGLCTVSTDVGGIPDLVIDRVTALLTPSDDAEAAAASISELIENPMLAAAISAAGRRQAEAFDWSYALASWEHLFLRIQDEKTPPRYATETAWSHR